MPAPLGFIVLVDGASPLIDRYGNIIVARTQADAKALADDAEVSGLVRPLIRWRKPRPPKPLPGQPVKI